ncbi:MAG: hypothetical protein KAT46_01760 [Deltaproteobacteria bacterium]|nr:hypothetical protein [Deltaproteobacteria bacterium]
MKRLLLPSLIIAVFMILAISPKPAAAAGLGEMTFDNKIESMKKAGVGPVIFSHTTHENTIKCAECHPDIFIEKRGANDMSMKKNMDGEHCGACHDSTVAFPMYQCSKCHTQVGAAK